MGGGEVAEGFPKNHPPNQVEIFHVSKMHEIKGTN